MKSKNNFLSRNEVQIQEINMRSKIKYIDLFSGIGGFHQAMKSFDAECVLASEIDNSAIEVYKKNYNIDSNNDIRDIDKKMLEGKKIDLLCGGFPCQSFSQAGSQAGFEDETKGTLFFEIKRILKIKIDENNPIKYIMLENVANLVAHDNGKTYKVIIKNLTELGYVVSEKPIIASPHMIGIPQLRKRVFIIGVHKSFKQTLEYDNSFLNKKKENICYSVVSKVQVKKEYYISEYEIKVLTAWDEFYQNINLKVIGFPIWSEYFNDDMNFCEPPWKEEIIVKNKKFYKENKKFIDIWMKKHDIKNKFVKTHRKFEWQAGNHIKSIWEGIIQFRPSGIRVKKPTDFPALVAMTHIPIIGKYKRRLTVEEVAKLQSFPSDFKIDGSKSQAYKQFGNSVNVELVRLILKELLEKN